MRVTPVLTAAILSAAAPLGAQQLSGEGSCSKPDSAHTIAVGSRADHLFIVSRSRCTWTKPFEIGGSQAIGGIATQFDEVRGNRSRFQGVYLDQMSNGDTVRYRYEGTSTSKDGRPQSVEWNWVLGGGTGKFSGLRGKGKCKGGWDSQGKSSWRCTGRYQL